MRIQSLERSLEQKVSHNARGESLQAVALGWVTNSLISGLEGALLTVLVLMAAVLAGFGKLALRPKTQLSCQDLSVCLDFFGAQGLFLNSRGSYVRRLLELLKEVVISSCT